MGAFTVNVPVPKFDPTITWGHILTALSFAAFGIGAYLTIKTDINAIQLRMAGQEQLLKTLSDSTSKLADVVIITARQDERLNGFGQQIRSIEIRLDRLEARVPPRP